MPRGGFAAAGQDGGAALGPDEATWARGRGWALYAGVIALDFYRDGNPVLAGICRRTIREVLGEPGRA